MIRYTTLPRYIKFKFILVSSGIAFFFFLPLMAEVGELGGVSEITNKKRNLMDFIFPNNDKHYYQTEGFKEIMGYWEKGLEDELKNQIKSQPNLFSYGLLQFGGRNLKNNFKKHNKIFSNKKERQGYNSRYNGSVWTLIYSYKLHPSLMIALIDFRGDGYVYTGEDTTVDQVAYISMDEIVFLDHDDRYPIRFQPNKFVFEMPFFPNEIIFKNLRYEFSQGGVGSDYFRHYANALNCVRYPFEFKPFKGQLVLLKGDCPTGVS